MNELTTLSQRAGRKWLNSTTSTRPTPGRRGHEPLEGGTLRLPHSSKAAILPALRTLTRTVRGVTADHTPPLSCRSLITASGRKPSPNAAKATHSHRREVGDLTPAGGRSRPPRAIYNPQRVVKASDRIQ